MRKQLQNILLFLGLASILIAQPYSKEYDFKILNTEAGLSRTTVMTIHKDNEGFMWFGSANGLNKFDGSNFEIITDTPADSFALSDKGVNAIVEDNKQNLWLGMHDGVLNKFNKSTYLVEHIEIDTPTDSLANQNTPFYDGPLIYSRVKSETIINMEPDGNGNIWIGTWGRGIKVYNIETGKVKHIFHLNVDDNSLISNRILDFHFWDDFTVFVATYGGGIDILHLKNTKSKLPVVERIEHPQTKSKYFSDLYFSRDSVLWAGSNGDGLYKLNYKGGEFSVDNIYRSSTRNKNSITNNRVTTIDEDSRGNLWIGTFRGGVSMFNPSTKIFQTFKNNPQIPGPVKDNEILKVFVDNFDIVWVAPHLGSGILKISYKPDNFKSIKKQTHYSPGLNDNIIWSIASTDNNTLWVGTYRGGLNKVNLKTNKIEYFNHDPEDPNSLPHEHIRKVYPDKYGNLWLGTYSKGLVHFNLKTKKFTSFRHNPEDPSSIGANQVLSILIDDADTVWVGTYGGGLNCFLLDDFYKGKKFAFKKFQNISGDSSSLANNNVYCFVQDKDKNFWLGLFGAGIAKFDRKTRKFTNYCNDPSQENTLGDNRVMVLHIDKNNNIWVGTYGGGLNRFDLSTGRFHQYNETTGFRSNVIYGILEDDKNNLWLSSDNGIIKFNYNFYSVSYFDVSDGLLSMEYSGGAYYKHHDGTLFFGGINGINYFVPSEIRHSFRSVPVLITKFSIFNKPIRGVKRSIELNYDQNFFSFEFAALDYSNNQYYNYSYMMEGLDNVWHTTSQENRSVNYANLSPGNYTFRIRASDKYGVWSSLEDKVTLKLLPPFWMTWWFITLIAATIIIMVYAIFRLRLNQLLAIERIKTKLAADLHDNVGAGLTEISIMSELTAAELKNASPAVSKRLNNISETARLLVDSMSDIVWMVNPKRDSLRDLLIKLKDSYSDLLTHMGVAFKVSSFEELEDIKLTMEYKQNLYLIFKEGINNSIKHSNCKRISLEAKLNGDGILMMLKDDGVGMVIDNENPGNGIKNIYRRAETIGGDIVLKAEPNKGTEIVFRGKFGAMGKLKSWFID